MVLTRCPVLFYIHKSKTATRCTIVRNFCENSENLQVLKKFGFTAENVAEKGRKVYEYYQKVPAHNLITRVPF